MCGCNTNVKFDNTTKVTQAEQFVVPRFKRSIRQSCDTFGNCGRIEENNFQTSEDVAKGQATSIKFSDRRSTKDSALQNFPAESIITYMPGTRQTAIGLRQLAEEFASMADALDGQKTTVTLLGGSLVVTKRKKAKSKAKKLVKIKK